MSGPVSGKPQGPQVGPLPGVGGPQSKPQSEQEKLAARVGQLKIGEDSQPAGQAQQTKPATPLTPEQQKQMELIRNHIGLVPEFSFLLGDGVEIIMSQFQTPEQAIEGITTLMRNKSLDVKNWSTNRATPERGQNELQKQASALFGVENSLQHKLFKKLEVQLLRELHELTELRDNKANPKLWVISLLKLGKVMRPMCAIIQSRFPARDHQGDRNMEIVLLSKELMDRIAQISEKNKHLPPDVGVLPFSKKLLNHGYCKENGDWDMSKLSKLDVVDVKKFVSSFMIEVERAYGQAKPGSEEEKFIKNYMTAAKAFLQS